MFTSSPEFYLSIGLFIFLGMMISLIVYIFSSDRPTQKQVEPKDPKANLYKVNDFELSVHQTLKRYFYDTPIYLNYMLGTGTTSTQIDHLVLTRKAIFVIESKDYKGTIYANIKNQNWSQNLKYVKSTPSQTISYSKYGKPYQRYYLKKHVKNYSLYNPVLQNQGHIQAIKPLIASYNLPIVSVIVFSHRGSLSIEPFEQQHLFIVKENELGYIIKAYLDTRINRISEEEFLTLENAVTEANSSSINNIDQHIKRISELNENA